MINMQALQQTALLDCITCQHVEKKSSTSEKRLTLSLLIYINPCQCRRLSLLDCL